MLAAVAVALLSAHQAAAFTSGAPAATCALVGPNFFQGSTSTSMCSVAPNLNTFSVTVPATYTPGQALTLPVGGSDSYVGFYAHATKGSLTVATAPSGGAIGAGPTSGACATLSTLTHDGSEAKTGGSFRFTPPAAGSGTVKLLFMFVKSRAGGGQCQYQVVELSLTEAAGPTPAATPSPTPAPTPAPSPLPPGATPSPTPPTTVGTTTTVAPTTTKVAPTTTAAPAVAGDPCASGSGTFKNSAEVTLAATPVKISVKGDCAKKELEFTVSGTSKGWLAFGFADEKEMPGTDVYQVYVENGKGFVRNAFAKGYTLAEDEAAKPAVSGSRTGDTLTVTFTRPFASSNGANDKVLGFGNAYTINVAKRDDNDVTKKHGARASSSAAIDLFAVKPSAPPVDCKKCVDVNGLLEVGATGSDLWCDCCIGDCEGIQPSCIKEALCVDHCVKTDFCEEFLPQTTKRVGTTAIVTAAAQPMLMAVATVVLAVAALF